MQNILNITLIFATVVYNVIDACRLKISKNVMKTMVFQYWYFKL